MRKELHVSHIPQPLNQLPFPFQVKKKQKKTRKKQKEKNQKKTKNKNYACAFFRLPHGSERSKRDIYIHSNPIHF